MVKEEEKHGARRKGEERHANVEKGQKRLDSVPRRNQLIGFITYTTFYTKLKPRKSEIKTEK